MAGGCESCEQNLQAEIEAAAAQEGDDLDEDVQAVLEGERDPPFAYGPLSGWTGPYCRFCHGVGHVIAVAVLGAILAGGYYGGVTVGYTVAFGLFAYIPLAVTVLYLGRFPLLGALVGPWFEFVMGTLFNICFTKHAEKKYCAGGIVMDGGEPEPMRENVHGPEMHVVAEPWAVEQCASPSAPSALLRIEIEDTPVGPRIKNVHNFDPEVNYFENIQYHVDPGAPTVCHTPEQELMTTLDFDKWVKSGGQEGISRE